MIGDPGPTVDYHAESDNRCTIPDGKGARSWHWHTLLPRQPSSAQILQSIRSSNSRSRLPGDQRSTTESTEIHGKENPNQLPLSVSFPRATPARRVGSFRGYPFVMIFLAGVIPWLPANSRSQRPSSTRSWAGRRSGGCGTTRRPPPGCKSRRGRSCTRRPSKRRQARRNHRFSRPHCCSTSRPTPLNDSTWPSSTPTWWSVSRR